MKGASLLTTGMALTLALALAGCGTKQEAAAPASWPTLAVRAQVVETKQRVATEEVVGTVRARLRSVIEAKVSGKVDQMLVVPGQQVKTGELLAHIDAREVQARLDQAIALRQQAEADLKRDASLLEQKILAQSQYDNTQARFRVAQGAVLEAEALIGYTKVSAPFDGVITRKHADVGDLAAPGKPLLEMEDSHTLRLEADVPEAVVSKVSLGDKLAVRIAALETELEGTVSEIAPTADPVSRTFLVKLDLPAKPGLRAGQFGRVAMPVGEASALRVPASAIVVRGQMEIVFVATDQRANLRLVKTGKRMGDEVEILSGLSTGEKVVTERAGELTDGQPVSLQP
ncbi:MAG TPA: efflux RND transporter periplasmic adaptor subunit [Verrucomicrobiae bacterium]|nr:efflux RND transporter periplasmic adaptor subunit [Verrucomicrobiae bacterium]